MSPRERIARPARARRPAQPQEHLQQLTERFGHLEALVEGLQVHRDSVRHEQRIAELERKTQPEALTQALSSDARRRGLSRALAGVSVPQYVREAALARAAFAAGTRAGAPRHLLAARSQTEPSRV